MKLLKKLTALVLSASMALTVATVVLAEPELPSRFASFSGKIVSVDEQSQMSYVSVENEDGENVYFVLNPNTYVTSKDIISVGTSVTGFYNGSAPMILIYPPQYTIEALVASSEEENVKYSTFDENLTSSDGMLKLNISEDTKIVSQDGEAFDGAITGKRVLVFYSVSTRSIPAQTTPIRIIVLTDRELPPIQELLPENEWYEVSEENFANDISSLANDDILVKLRTVTQELGIELTWLAEDHKVLVGGNIALTIGSPNVEVNGVTLTLSSAPQIVNGSTYVPLDFFVNVLALNLEN